VTADPQTVLMLSPDERELILTNVTLPSGLTARFRFAVHQGDLLEVSLNERDLADFLHRLTEAMLASEDNEFLAAVAEITRRNVGWSLEDELDDFIGEIFPEDTPREVLQQIRQLFQEGDFASSEEAFEAVQQLVDEHNNRPVEEFHGLSPRQLVALLETAWDETDTAVTLSGSLSPEDLRDSSVAQNAHGFLAAVAGAGPVRLTARGNLNRKFFRHLLDVTHWPHWDVDDLLGYYRNPNEADIRPLHYLRIYLEAAGLVAAHKGKMTVTKAGLALMEPSRAGELQVALFRAMCGEFNLAYMDRLPDFPQIQQTYPVILYNLGRLAAEEVGVDMLWRKIYLPSVYESIYTLEEFEMEEIAMEQDESDDFALEQMYAKLALRSRVLRPLIDFGLLAPRYHEISGTSLKFIESVKTTALFHKMIHFSL